MRIAVIGAGIVGSLIARELARYDAEILVFDREPEAGFGVTKANSAIVHAGFHDEPGTLRAKFCVLGNTLYPELCQELSVPFRRVGAFVLAFSKKEEEILRKLKDQGEANGVPDLALVSRDEVLAREPRVNPAIRRALWAQTVAITEPWAVAQAAAENAMANGIDFHFEEEVREIIVRHGRVQGIKTTKALYSVNAVVNAAGLYADEVSAMAGVSIPQIFPRRGQYVLLDDTTSVIVRSVIFPTPSPVSKGILVIPTIDGALLLGPTAEKLAPMEKEATQTTREGIDQVVHDARKLVPDLPLSRALKSFAGLRPEPATGDFILGPSSVRGFYQAAGMRSPGLTAAPAIAKFLAHDVIASELGLQRKVHFNPLRPPIPRIRDLPLDEWEKLIKDDPRWGKVVCFCNFVTEAQIIEAIRRGARTLDGIKFRTGAGFGRCQGSFCTAQILRIMTKELGLTESEVTLRGSQSVLVTGKVRP